MPTAAELIARTRELCAAKPVIRRVFSARGAHGWLFESHLGTEGLITERAVYADVLTHLWNLMESGKDPGAVREIYAKLLLIFNLGQHLPVGVEVGRAAGRVRWHAEGKPEDVAGPRAERAGSRVWGVPQGSRGGQDAFAGV